MGGVGMLLFRAGAVLVGALVCVHAWGQTPAKDFVNGKRLSYSTAGNEKAKGVDVTFEYPASWRAEDGKRANTLVQVTSKGGKGLELCNLVINRIELPPNYKLTDQDIDELFDPSEAREFAPRGAKVLGASRTTIDGQPAAQLQFITARENAGQRMSMMAITYQAYFDGRFISFACMVGEREGTSEDTLQRHYNAFLPTFRLMANSLVIQSKWKRPR